MPIIVDRPLYRELAKRAIMRTVEQLRTTKQPGPQPADAVEDARREHGCRVRELAEQAHGANLDLGRELMANLAVVDASDMRVARFIQLCGHPDSTNSVHPGTGRLRRPRRRFDVRSGR